jgi:type I restriction enzyme S subunit
MPRASWDFIGSLPVVVPPLDEQRAVVLFLDRETARIDALIEKKRRQIELLHEKRAALISHAVTKGLDPNAPMKDSGIEWLGAVPAHWRVLELRRVASDLQTGPFGSQLHASDYVDAGIPIVNPANIQDGVIIPDSRTSVDDDTFARLRRYALEEGDIIFGRRGEMGRCALVRESEQGFLCGTGSIRVRLRASSVHPGFLAFFLRHPGVHDHLLLESVGSTMDNLNTTIIGRIPIALPPFQEQLDIEKQIHQDQDQVDRLVVKIGVSIDRLREYRTALISAAVTGKIDVRKEVA